MFGTASSWTLLQLFAEEIELTKLFHTYLAWLMDCVSSRLSSLLDVQRRSDDG
jgi:hypothetical protein